MSAWRWGLMLVAGTCALWSCEWTALASLRPASTAKMACACRGTAQCCCLRKPVAAHDTCHLDEAGKPPHTAQCALQADDCGRDSTAVGIGFSREMRLMARLSLGAEPVPHVLPQGVPPGVASALIDPPFVPPERIAT